MSEEVVTKSTVVKTPDDISYHVTAPTLVNIEVKYDRVGLETNDPKDTWAYYITQEDKTFYYISITNGVPTHLFDSRKDRATLRHTGKEVFDEYLLYLTQKSELCYSRAKTAHQIGGY